MTGFETKDSGKRTEYASGMVRDTQEGKPRFDLLFPEGVRYEDQMLTRLANLLARGAEKYSSRNWEKANSTDEVDRMKSSALRHLIQWVAGETDEDHAAAVMFNVLAAETTKVKLPALESLPGMPNPQPHSHVSDPRTYSWDVLSHRNERPQVTLEDEAGDYWYYDFQMDSYSNIPDRASRVWDNYSSFSYILQCFGPLKEVRD